MKPPILELSRNGWSFALPTIRAYAFTDETLDEFFKPDRDCPMVLDINIDTGCNAGCLYCYTEQGTVNRFAPDPLFQPLSDELLIEIIKQFGQCGGAVVFICSNGEPLTSPKRFMQIVDASQGSGVTVLTYTNAVNLTPNVLRDLHRAGVNLVLKLESLDPQTNDAIIRPRISYKYVSFENGLVPEQIAEAYAIYGSDSDMLALSTMLTALNLQGISDLRTFAFRLGSAHFLKKLYYFGGAEENRKQLQPAREDEDSLIDRIVAADQVFGIRYPPGHFPDEYSFDVRRFLNNAMSPSGFPLRIFGHPCGGVYHSSDSVKPDFGFGTPNIISMVNNGDVDIAGYFQKIYETIRCRTLPK